MASCSDPVSSANVCTRQQRARDGFAEATRLASFGLAYSELEASLPPDEWACVQPALADGSLVLSVTATMVGTKVAIVVSLRLPGGDLLKQFLIEPINLQDVMIDDEDLPPNTPVAKLGQLYSELSQPQPGRGVSPSSREFVLSAIEAAVRRDEPIHSSMGLSGSGQYGSLQAGLLLVKRNHHLLEAFESVSLNDGELDHTRCRRLSIEIARFMSREWPQAKRRVDPDPTWPMWKVSVFRAAQTGLHIELAPNTLNAIVQASRGFSPNGRGTKVLADLL